MNDNCPPGSDYDVDAPWKEDIPKEKEVDITLNIKVIATIKAYNDSVKNILEETKALKTMLKTVIENNKFDKDLIVVDIE